MKTSAEGSYLVQNRSSGYKSITKMTDLSRVASFYLYPYSSEVQSLVLAEAGFHYDGHGDAVICRNCGLRHSGWQKGDDPRTIHLEMSPSCPFFQTSEPEATVYGGNSEPVLLSGACGGPAEASEERGIEDKSEQDTNTSIHTDNMAVHDSDSHTSAAIAEPENALEYTINISKVQNPRSDESGSNIPGNSVHGEDMTNSLSNSGITNPISGNEAQNEHLLRTEDTAGNVPSDETQTVESRDQSSRENMSNTSHDTTSHTMTNSTSTGSLETIRPKYEQFAILATRLNSYRYWPQNFKQRPEDLAKAGLFYEGKNDFVRCFHCAGGLREWDPEDDPFYEHARWFPFCPFMRLTKGDKFIMGVQSGTIKPPAIQRDVSSKENEPSLFEHPAVLSVMELGYSKAILTKAIAICRKRNGTDLSAEKLLTIVWEIEENDTMDVIQDDEISEKEQTNHNETETECESKSKSEETELATKEDSTHTKGIDELTEENRELREQKRCKVCLDEEASIVFLPCGHLVTCPMCAAALRKCPVCRTYIRGTVKVIIS